MTMAQQALTTSIACAGRFTLGVGPSHHWIIDTQLGLPYDRPARQVREYLDVLRGAFAARGPVDVENETYRVHSPIDVTDAAPPLLLAALGPTMLRLAGEHTGGTILWMADERAVAELRRPAHQRGRGRGRADRPRGSSPGYPSRLCSGGQVETGPRPRQPGAGPRRLSPNYLFGCSSAATPKDVGDTMAAGDEAAVLSTAAPLPRRGRHRPGCAGHRAGRGSKRSR